MIAKVLRSRDGDACTLIKLITCGINCYLPSTFSTLTHAERVWRYSLNDTFHVGHKHNVAEGILLSCSQSTDVNLYLKDIIGSWDRSQVIIICGVVRTLFHQSGTLVSGDFVTLTSAKGNDIKVTAIGSYATGMESKRLRSNAETLLRFHGECDGIDILLRTSLLCGLEHRFQYATVCACAIHNEIVTYGHFCHTKHVLFYSLGCCGTISTFFQWPS